MTKRQNVFAVVRSGDGFEMRFTDKAEALDYAMEEALPEGRRHDVYEVLMDGWLEPILSVGRF